MWEPVTVLKKKLVTNANIPYHAISAGKLRRYWSLQNFLDIFKTLTGIIQSFVFLLRYSKKTLPGLLFWRLCLRPRGPSCQSYRVKSSISMSKPPEWAWPIELHPSLPIKSL